MKFKFKRLKIALLIALVFFIFVGTGELLFCYSLLRIKEKPSGSNRKVPSIVTENNARIIEENKKTSQKNLENWNSLKKADKISVFSNDGLKLVATFFKNQEKPVHKYAIVIHGYSNSKENVFDIAQSYFNKGFNVITPDLRAHGESEGKYIGMGWLDKEDIKKWIEYIVHIDKNAEIFLHGVSMGAATAIMTSGESLPQNVKGVIEDCGYTSVKDIFSSELKARFHLPAFPVLYPMAISTYLHAGYNILEASSLTQLSKSNLPLLVIHSTADNFVPIEMAYKIRDAAAKKNILKDILIIKGAGHCDSRFLSPKEYYNKVWNFVDSL